jgi:hypothetical protein
MGDRKKENSPRRLNLYSIRDLEHRLGFSRESLRDIANSAIAYYSPFELPQEPRPFAKIAQKSKSRRIDRPIGALREVQDRIYYRLLSDLKLPTYLCGAVKGRSVMMNVHLHDDAPVLVTMDIKSWFPSITPRHVYRALRAVLNCSKPVAKLLTALTTFDGRLPQGASTSSAIANLVLYSIDGPLRARALDMNVNYSSWVDDLPFSGSNARQIIPIAISTLKGAGFRIARSKLLVMGRGERKIVNGIVLGKRPSTPKQHRARIRSALHHLRVGHIRHGERDHYIASLRGRIVHLSSVNPDQAKTFSLALQQISVKIAHAPTRLMNVL